MPVRRLGTTICAVLLGQRSLFGYEEPSFDEAFAASRRTELEEGAWLDYVPEWLSGHARLLDELAETVRWQSECRKMYEKTVDTPRLFAVLPDDGPAHPVLERMRLALSRKYAVPFDRVSLALYRDGRDSVAWHGDRVARRMPETLVATVSLGAPRRFLLRPYGGGASVGWSLGYGDLLVMGGSCQRTWQHSIPKVARADARIAIMFRPTWSTRSRYEPGGRHSRVAARAA